MKIIFDTITRMVGPGGLAVDKLTGVSIVDITPQEKKIGWEKMSEKKYLAHVIKRSVPPGLAYEIVGDDVIPADRTFRGAWMKKSINVEVDMLKAQVIHMGRIRKAREEALDKSDKELVQAMEAGADLATLKKKRQVLRNVPQSVNLGAAKTPEQLKTIWPKELPKL